MVSPAFVLYVARPVESLCCAHLEVPKSPICNPNGNTDDTIVTRKTATSQERGGCSVQSVRAANDMPGGGKAVRDYG